MQVTDNVLLLQHTTETKTLTVTVTILQTDVIQARPEANMAAAWDLMAAAPGADIYVLPEMWIAGFPASDTQSHDDALTWMRRAAAATGAAVSGTLTVRGSDGFLRNRHYFIKPDGTTAYYDKRHLFTHGGEDGKYINGNSRVIVKHAGMRFLLLTCYDLRFPVWARCRQDYDAIILPAQWPAKRMSAWHILTRARAIENQCYIIAANRTASHDAHYIGYSAVIDYAGRTIAQARDRIAQTVTATISKAALDNARATFPALADADNFNIFI